MNSDFLNFHTAALAEVTAFLGSPFTYNGTVYTGVINAIELSNELVEGGLMESLGSQIIVPKTSLPNTPKTGETVFIGTVKARINKVETDEVSYTITCVTAKK
jgi:hypothetical protein